jgi:DNA polymerase
MNKKQQLTQLNKQIRTCQQCKLAETRTYALPGEGKTNARLFLIAQAPGEVEDNNGTMFLGPSGEVLDKLLDSANVSRDEIYMTNLIKCHLPKNRKPKQEEIQACHHYLDQEINIINPEFLIPLGHYATRYLLQKYNQKIPSKHDFYKLYGTLHYIHEQKIYPVQHPAAPLHEKSLQPVLEKNYHKLSVFSLPCKWAPTCPMKYYYEKGLLDRKWRELYCFGDWENCKRYQMEEQNNYHEDWMLPDGSFDETLKNK